MGCLRRILVVCDVLLLTVSALLSLLVLGSAGVLGEAALIAAEDAIILIILNILSLIAIAVLILMLWQGSRTRSRLEKKITDLERPPQLIAQPATNVNAPDDGSLRPSAGLSLSMTSSVPRYCRRCGASLDGTLNFCSECGERVVRNS